MNKKPSILYIDDEQLNLESFRLIFQKEYSIEVTHTPEEAFSILEKKDIDIFIADYKMPGINGIELIEKVKNKYPYIVSIILSAYYDSDVTINAINSGNVHRFVLKPWNENEMKMALDSAYQNAILKRENKQLINDLFERNQELVDLLAKLNESNQLTESVFENTPLIMMLIDEDSRIYKINKAGQDFTGFYKQEEKGLRCGQFFQCKNTRNGAECSTQPECSHCDINNAIIDCFKTGKPHYKEESVLEIHKNHKKTAYNVFFSNSIIFNQGKKNQLICIDDITELKAARIKEQESNMRFKQLFDNIPDGVAAYQAVNNGEDFIIIDINSAGQKLTNTFSDDIIGRSVKEVFPNIEQMGLFKVIQDVYATGKPGFLPLSMEKDKKLDRWFENTVFKIPNGNIIAIFQDVSERRISEQALIKSEKRFKSLFTQMTSAFALHELIYDNNGVAIDYKFIDVNPAFESMTGLLRENIINRSVQDVLPETEAYWVYIYNGVVESGESLTFQNYTKALNKYFEITAYSPEEKQFATIFSDITPRIKIENALKESEQKYKTITTNSMVGIWHTDVKDNTLYVNPSLINMLEVDSPTQLKRKRPKSYLSKQSALLYEKEKEKCLSGHISSFEAEIVSHYNNTSHVVLTIVPVFNENGELTSFLNTYTDITPQKKAEAALRENEEKYRSLVDLAPIGIIIFNNEGIAQSVNKAMIDIAEVGEDEIIGKHFAKLPVFKQKNQSILKKMFEVIIKLKKEQSLEFDWKHKDGTLHYGEAKIAMIMGKNKYTGVQMLIKDITLEKLSHQAIQESEKRYRTLFNEANEAIYIHNDKGEIIDVNQKACTSLGYSREELLTKNISDIDVNYALNLKKLPVPLKLPVSFETINRTKKGKRIPVEVQLDKIELENKEYIIAFSLDISDRKEAERKIFNAVIETEEKERKRFSEDLHDELGPFLSGIKLYLNELAYEETDKEHRKKMVQYLKQMTDEAVQKIKNISNELMPTILMDYGLVRAITSFCKKIELTNYIRFQITSNPEKITIDNVIESVLYRVIIELINNTLKHARAKKIKINISEKEKKLYIMFEDDGIGFDFEKKLTLSHGMGLTNITNRLKSINARYKVLKSRSKGFKFQLELDLKMII